MQYLSHSSGGGILCEWLDFTQETRFHVEDETSDGNLLGDPWVRSHLQHLFPRVLSGILVGEEVHRSRRCFSRYGGEFRVQLVIAEGGESAAGVIEQHDLRRSE